MAARGAPRAGACAGGGGPGRVAPARCVAVGGTERGAGPARPLAREWAGGSWRPLPVPAPRAGLLLGVSCRTASACLAVGAAPAGHGPAGPATALAGPLAEWWNGRRWRRLTPVIPPGAQAAWLADASCPARPGCVAV